MCRGTGRRTWQRPAIAGWPESAPRFIVIADAVQQHDLPCRTSPCRAEEQQACKNNGLESTGFVRLIRLLIIVPAFPDLPPQRQGPVVTRDHVAERFRGTAGRAIWSGQGSAQPASEIDEWHGAEPVAWRAGKQRIRLNQGDALSRADRNGAPALRKESPEGIGSWQSGQLHYDDATLDQVARDLSRNTGRSIRVANGAARLRFTGTLVLRGPPREVLARAGPLLGVTFAEQGDSWTMTPANVRRR